MADAASSSASCSAEPRAPAARLTPRAAHGAGWAQAAVRGASPRSPARAPFGPPGDLAATTYTEAAGLLEALGRAGRRCG
ncbi:hypothetical protein QJS66_05630 [Kocuria rhizophila]|nr:hypothetical protein QJS66_05630 [Kocuria rhizophila]